jgi:hypothetical protein
MAHLNFLASLPASLSKPVAAHQASFALPAWFGTVLQTQFIRQTMNFSDTVKTLNSASAFELYRLRAAIDRVLGEPRWLQAIQSRLKVGQEVQFFDERANKLKRGQVLEMRRKELVVLDLDDIARWILPYAAINIDGIDVDIREQKPQGLGRNEVARGDVLGFLDREQQQRIGTVIRLNDKTVTLQCDKVQWRVGYGLLHRVVDVDGTVQVVVQTPTLENGR